MPISEYLFFCFFGVALGIGCTLRERCLSIKKQALKQALKHMLLCYISISYLPNKTYHFMPLIHIFYIPKTYSLTLFFHIFLTLNRYVFCIILYSFYCPLDNTLRAFCYLAKYSSYYFCHYMISYTKIFFILYATNIYLFKRYSPPFSRYTFSV